MVHRIGFLGTFVSILVVCATPSDAALTASDSTADLDSLIAVALRNNPEIRSARYESMAAEARIGPASRLPDPQLRVAAMNIPTNFTLTSDMMTMAPQVTLMQMFPWFGKIGAAADVRRYSYESSADKLSSVSLEVVMNLKKVYGRIYSIERSLDYLEYKMQLLHSVVKVAEQLFAVGQVPQQDVFRATAELTMVQSDILTMRSMLLEARARLGALLGENAPTGIRVDTLQLSPLDSLTVLEVRLARDNPELKQIRSVELAAQARTSYVRKDAIPDLSVGVSYGYRGTRMPDGTKALDMMNFEVGLSLPIFFGSRQQAMIDEAEYMERASTQQYHSAELALYSQLRSVYAEARAQHELIPLYSRELIPQYEATYNASLSAYSVGKTSFAMLIDNLTTLINAKMDLVKIESAGFSATAEIARLVGEGSENSRGVK